MSSPENTPANQTANQATDAQPTVPQPTLPQPSLSGPPAPPQPRQFPQPAAPQGYAATAVQPRPVAPTNLAQTNAFALVSIITAFLQPIAAVVFGHLALGQIKRTGDGGRGLALTGLIIGYVYLASLVMFIILYVSLAMLFVGSMSALLSELGNPSYMSDLNSIPDFDSEF